MAESFLTAEEQKAIEELKEDAHRLTRRNYTILKVVDWLEGALEENQQLRKALDSLEGKEK